jgi:ABC-type Fe3+/spermidine/putrescine transport system ATPase subunit
MNGIRLSLQGITKRFGSARAVDGISLDIRAGETFSFLGPSGCGKTTTLRMIAGLDVPDEGEILLDGLPIVSVARRMFTQPEKRRMGMVFQSYAIWPHMTVAENIAFPLRVRGTSRLAIREKVRNALDLVGLAAFADRPAPRLSGGQQQRVALARALVYEPAVLLLDEPMSNLDVKLREQMRVELKLLQQKLGLTLVYVTHDQVEALSLSDTVAVMNNGRTEQIGSPHDLYERPATPFVRDFLGKSVTVRGRVVSSGPDGTVLEAMEANGARLHCRAHGMAVGHTVVLSIRPEAVAVLTTTDPGEANVLVGTVAAVLYQGERSECEIRVGDERISAYLQSGTTVARGQTVAVKLPAEHISLWPGA